MFNNTRGNVTHNLSTHTTHTPVVQTHSLNMLLPSNFTRLCLSLDMVSCACTSSTSSVYCSHSTLLLDGFLCGTDRPACCWVSTHIGSSQRQKIQYNMSNTMLMNFPFDLLSLTVDSMFCQSHLEIILYLTKTNGLNLIAVVQLSL